MVRILNECVVSGPHGITFTDVKTFSCADRDQGYPCLFPHSGIERSPVSPPATFSHRIRVNLGHSCSPAHTTVDQPVRAHKPFVPSFLRYLAIMSSEPAVKFLLGIPDEGAINFVVRISNVFCRRGPHYDLLPIIGPAPVGQWQGTQPSCQL